MSSPEWVKTAKAGDKVVCIGVVKDCFVLDIRVPHPEIGEVVEIKQIGEAFDDSAKIVLTFIEYPGYPIKGICWGYPPHNFKPVQKSRTDISIFKKMLKKQSEDA